MCVKKIVFDISKIEFSRKDLKKGITLPTTLTTELAEDIGIHLGDGSMNIFHNPHGIDYFYKCSGHTENEKEWYDSFIVPLKLRLFNLKIQAKYLSDNTYSIQFRSKAIITFYHKIINLPLGNKVKTIDIPKILKTAPLCVKISCLRGIFDTDFSLTFKKKHKNTHYYPVISCSVASKPFINSIKNILTELNFKFFDGKFTSLDKRTNHTKIIYGLFISGKKQLNKWFQLVGSHNLNDIINPLSLENNGPREI